MQSQESLFDQIKRLIPLADKAGLYDASDWLRTHVDTLEAKQQVGRRSLLTLDEVKRGFGSGPLVAVVDAGLINHVFWRDASGELCGEFTTLHDDSPFPCVWDGRQTSRWIPY